MALKPNNKLVYDCVLTAPAEGITAPEIAEQTGLDVRQVNGIVTSAFQRKGLMIRTPVEIELDNGERKIVKMITLTDEGKAFDPDAEEE